MKKLFLIITTLIFILGFSVSAFAVCSLNAWNGNGTDMYKIVGAVEDTCDGYKGMVIFTLAPITHVYVVQNSNSDFTTHLTYCNNLDINDRECLEYNPDPIFAYVDNLMGLGMVTGIGPVPQADRFMIQLAFLYEMYLMDMMQQAYQQSQLDGYNDVKTIIAMKGACFSWGFPAINCETVSSDYVLSSIKAKYNELGVVKVPSQWKMFINDFGDVVLD